MNLPLNLAAWAMRHHVSDVAMSELISLAREPMALAPLPEHAPGTSEAWSQSVIRLEAPHRDVMLFRNNVGVLENEAGRPVRYGLGNDSPAMNRALKSSDLIGWRRLLITPTMVGRIVAQFVSRECKRPGWTYRGDDREQAQLAWNNLVNADGGDAAFATGQGTL